MNTSKKPNDVRAKHQMKQPAASEPAAHPRGGTHPETVKPDEPNKAPTRKTERSGRDTRTKDDKDGNEQQ